MYLDFRKTKSLQAVSIRQIPINIDGIRELDESRFYKYNIFIFIVNESINQSSVKSKENAQKIEQ